jgi:hypothetical protein
MRVQIEDLIGLCLGMLMAIYSHIGRIRFLNLKSSVAGGIWPRTRKARLLIARSPRWQAPVAIPIGEDFQTRALPLPHRPCRRKLSFDPTHARGVFEIDGNRVLVVPDVDAIARPSAESR